MRRSVWSLLGLILFAQAAAAQTAKAWDDAKPAWQWALEERLAKRFDPAEVAAREALAEKRTRELATFPWPWDGERGEVSELNGRDHPELFTPMELFIHLVDSAYPYPPDGRQQRLWRQLVEDDAAALGFGADLWQRLRRVASPYLKLLQEDYRIAIAEQLERGPTPPEVLCRVRRDALDAALDEFGKEAFLQLLYEVVAPPMSMPRLTPDSVRRWEEGRCR